MASSWFSSNIWTNEILRRGDTETSQIKAPDLLTRNDEVSLLLKKKLQLDGTWYLVDVRWFEQWKKYVGFDELNYVVFDVLDQGQMGTKSPHPGPVNTSALLSDKDPDVLKDDLRKDKDYSLVPEEAWKKFVDWYGLEESSIPIPRPVVKKYRLGSCYVEVYLEEFKLALHPNVRITRTMKFSRKNTAADVMKMMKKTFSIPEEKECRVWHSGTNDDFTLFISMDTSLHNFSYSFNVIQKLLLEQKNEDGTWPRSYYRRRRKSLQKMSSTFNKASKSTEGEPTAAVKSKAPNGDNELEPLLLPTDLSMAKPVADIEATKSKPPDDKMLDKLSASHSSKLPHCPKLKVAVSEVSQVSVVQEDTQRENAALMITDHVEIEDRCQSQFKTTALDAIVQSSSNTHQQVSCKQQTRTNQLNTEAIKLQKSSSDLLDPFSVNDSTKLPTSASEVKPSVPEAKEVTMVASSEEFTTLKAEMQQAIKLEIESRSQTEFERILHLDEKIQKNENKSSQDLVTLQNRFHQKEREIATLSNKLSQSESQTALISQNLTELTQQCKEESEAKNQQLRAMNQALTVANQEIAQLKKSLQVKDNELTVINQEIGVLRESVQIKDRELRERLQTKEDEIATLRESFQQRETGSAQEIATLTERLQAQETQLQAQEAQQHTQVAQLQGQLQTQATQMQTFCNNALQQMRQQIERDVQRRMERLTNQMTTMQTVFNAVKPQWLVARHEITLTQNILGNGGWGRVVQATFRGEQVAAKCLHHQIISEYNIRHFVREMQISAKCHHPNLLKFLGATLEGDPIILTELMQTNLHDVIRQHELKDHQFILLLPDIAGAINYLHSLSPEPIIHRDISSSNVLLKGPIGSKWIAKLSDFGSANFLWHTSDQSRAPGNPTYAAPEVLSPHSHSEKMDVYSFGVLVFEMCSGQSPSLQVRNEVLPSAAAVWPEPQRHYASMIVSCTRENKDDRPTMSEVLAKL